MRSARSLDQQGIWLIAGSFVVLAVAAALVAWRQAQVPQLDPVTLCAARAPIAGEVVVLLDVTDHLTPEEMAAFTGWLHTIERTELRRNVRLSLWVLGGDRGLERRFSRCYPGRESDPIFHNPGMSAAACDSLFSHPLRVAVESAIAQGASPVSPILEAIRELSEQAEFAERTSDKRLILISDLRQHFGPLSFYRRVPHFAAFQQSGAMARLQANLEGVAVDVLYVPRGPGGGTLDVGLAAFWREYFAGCGADGVRLRRL